MSGPAFHPAKSKNHGIWHLEPAILIIHNSSEPEASISTSRQAWPGNPSIAVRIFFEEHAIEIMVLAGMSLATLLLANTQVICDANAVS